MREWERKREGKRKREKRETEIERERVREGSWLHDILSASGKMLPASQSGGSGWRIAGWRDTLESCVRWREE